MRAILIDPFTRTVSDIDTDAGLDDLYNILQCDMITVIPVSPGHAMILDDEGLLKDRDTQAYFELRGVPQPFAGRALIVADEEGENRAATFELGLIRSSVNFLDSSKVDPDSWAGFNVIF